MTDQPDRVPIYGWHRSADDPIQPLSLVHGAEYEDYSHGLRLIGTVACLNGEPVLVKDLFDEPFWSSMLSNETGVDPEKLSWSISRLIFDKAAMMPHWEPGRIRGIPFRAAYYVDILFDIIED